MVVTPHGQVAAADFGGDGPDLLLLHGAGRTLADWGLVVPLLKGRRVVAADFRWHGLSSDEGDVGLDANADDAEAVIAELGLQNPAVAGHSLGGMTAAVYGSRHPECPGVANLDGHGLGAREDYEGIGDDQYEAFLKRLGELSAQPDVQSGDDAWRAGIIAGWREIARLSGWFFPEEAADAINARSFQKDTNNVWHLRPNPNYMALLTPALGSVGLFDVYRKCECPLLIYSCTKMFRLPDADIDEVFNGRHRGLSRQLMALAAEKPYIQIRTVDASHFMIFDMPEQVAADILALTP